jgi:hypothetical protein
LAAKKDDKDWLKFEWGLFKAGVWKMLQILLLLFFVFGGTFLLYIQALEMMLKSGMTKASIDKWSAIIFAGGMLLMVILVRYIIVPLAKKIKKQIRNS